jgi:hypothetical protein
MIITPKQSPAKELTGLAALRWLEDQGAKFCKVSSWQSKGDSPGKRPFEAGWQNKPYTANEVLPHIQAGGNVGMLCGEHSGGLGLLDVDEDFPGFLDMFPHLANCPRIERDGADRAKLLSKFQGAIPHNKKWKHAPTDKHPFMELLSTGNQGVVPPSIHPETGKPYKLVNPDYPILEVTVESLSDICAVWGGAGLEDDEPQAPVVMPEYKPDPTNGDGLREQVIKYWTPLKVFEHFDMAQHGTRWEQKATMLRVFGNGGLFCHEDERSWCLAGQEGFGGGIFEAWMYSKTGNCKVPKDHGFYELLCEMAHAAGIEIPKTRGEPMTTIAEVLNVQNITEEVLSRPRYVIRDAAYALQPRPPIEHVIQGFAARGSVNLMVGRFGTKKTYILLSASVHVALGKMWLGLMVQPGNVLIIDEESGDERLSRRLGMAIRGELGDESTPIYYVSLAQFNLFKKPEDASLMTALIQEVDAKLVVIDALADIMAGGDENSVKDTQPVFMQLRKIAEESGAAIIVIHHANKTGDYRGSTAIPGAIDNMILVESADDSNFITFKSLKVRDGSPFQFTAEAHWTEDQFYLTATDFESKPGRASLGKPHRYVLRYLAAHDGEAPLTDIKDHADTCSSAGARDATYNLVDQGYIFRSDDGGHGIKATFKLTEKGQEWVEADI